MTRTSSIKHQFHQYQQNEQSPLILAELTEYKKDHNIWRWKSVFFAICYRKFLICYNNRLL